MGVGQQLASVQLNEDRLEQYLSDVFPMPGEQAAESAKQRIGLFREEFSKLFAAGRGNSAPKVRGTLWAAYNGVAEFIDYRDTRQTPSQRLESVWFGTGYLTKARAFKVALDKVAPWRN